MTGWAITRPHVVRWSECDPHAHVNHTVYLTLFEDLRIEHWRVAQQHARVAAYNMAGSAREYAGVPYFWTYHYEKTFDYLGHVSAPDSIEIDGDPDAQHFIAYLIFLHEESVSA